MMSMEAFQGVTVHSDGLITIATPSGNSVRLEMPLFEIDGRLFGKSLTLLPETEERRLRNAGLETKYHLRQDGFDDVALTLVLRRFSHSPFVRYRFELTSPTCHLTKRMEHREFLTFTAARLPRGGRMTELQISQFERNKHGYFPARIDHPETEYAEQTNFMGPILLWDGGLTQVLMGYEHGSETPYRYMEYCVARDADSLHVSVQAVGGTYCDGDSLAKTYNTVWFHVAVMDGTQPQLLEAYRTFFLKYISENTESRRPYIYYNTWNNQERNRAERGKPYLDTMRLEHILAEIEVAHRMGIDVFVMDTGWYQKTGDWLVNTDRFPDGLKKVKALLDQYHMKLGLWLNPVVAAKTSQVFLAHPEQVQNLDGKDSFWGPIWETEESYGMCLVSDYCDYFIEKLKRLNRELGVTYFKWDAVGMWGCNSPAHHHGTAHNTPEERHLNYSFQMGLRLIRIVEEVCEACPDAIFDFDITEDGRFVGLGFLSVGKFFHMNNGPYYMNFDIPDAAQTFSENVNVFFHPGVARSKVCRQSLEFDAYIPSILFLTHFLPDAPAYSQNAALASLMLGGNGIWGDLLSLDEASIARFSTALTRYKAVAQEATEAYPRVTGFVGSSPEIHEKLTPNGGLISFFTKEPCTVCYLTRELDLNAVSQVIGADSFRFVGNRLEISIRLAKDDARVVFVTKKTGDGSV